MSSKTIKYRNGQVILKEGEDTHEAYIIMTGNVIISNNGVNIASLGENEIFGELSWLQHTPRSATVTAQGDDGVSLRVINSEDAERFMKHNPKALIPLLKLVAARLQSTLKKVGTNPIDT
jgi:CRP/FNR family transcriptional regulator, cyclic AMP receptor protein